MLWLLVFFCISEFMIFCCVFVYLSVVLYVFNNYIIFDKHSEKPCRTKYFSCLYVFTSQMCVCASFFFHSDRLEYELLFLDASFFFTLMWLYGCLDRFFKHSVDIHIFLWFAFYRPLCVYAYVCIRSMLAAIEAKHHLI